MPARQLGMSQGDKSRYAELLDAKQGGSTEHGEGPLSADTAAPPLGYRPNEPTPGKDSLEHPQGRDPAQQPTCPDCGLPFGEHPEFHLHDAGEGGKVFEAGPPGDLD